MKTENLLSTLNIHKLTQEQYDRELAAGRIDENALYLTPEAEVDLSGYATETYVDTKISEIPTPDVSGQIKIHDESNTAHNDIRVLITNLTTRLNTLADSDEVTLDQMSEIVAYIKNNKDLIDGVTSSKVNVDDIANNLTTNVTNQPLSAAQGVALKALIDAIKVPTKVSELTNDKGYLTSAPVTTVNGKTGTVSLSASDVGAAAASHGNHVPTIETANNARFLRNDNTWQTVTPANIGARAETYTYASKNGGDCNTYVNETHLFVFNFTNKPAAFNYGWFDVWKASGDGFSPNGAKPVILQKFTCWNTYSRAWRYSTDNGATWSDWAYDNPPCEAGVEYVTTELYLGKPVKTKVINCGTVAKGGTLTFAHGCNISKMVRAEITADRNTLPLLYDGNPTNQYSITGYVDKTNVYAKNGSGNEPKSIHAQIWYTNT